MSRNPRLEEFEVERKPSKRSRKHSFWNFVFDEDTGAIMGRTPESWGKILIFYGIFYGALVALFAICMVTFMQQFINPRVPRLQQEGSLIGNSPGLGFRPFPPDVRSTLIWYKGTGYDSYKYWEDQLIDFLSVYKKKGQTAGAGQNIFNCDFRNPPPPGKVCDVDIRGWEPCIEENHFSFHKSSPCIFLKLNRIYGWRPEYYNDTQRLPSDMPADLQAHIRNITAYNRDYGNMIWVSCHGETPADEEMIGPIRYLPHPGFPGYFYPYNNAEGYLSPLVAVHLQRPRTGIVINIECRAWAPNIKYDRREKLGVVHFELMIE
ncbi:sodium/potassium-transporting ATPase subunit beta-2-like [Pectinophora gossypiella]|uniref:sodium/potassium-transporting ATPase subunit beta-2-like n=1 Tax=Pectinophora gossypiella TaxID=13191 RepID=UPI00214E1C21|nr:sodium/potassium-transporting ATPase subunit beta-2-like [Pectinophora gossypiella]